jgi:hypothetical protein
MRVNDSFRNIAFKIRLVTEKDVAVDLVVAVELVEVGEQVEDRSFDDQVEEVVAHAVSS